MSNTLRLCLLLRSIEGREAWRKERVKWRRVGWFKLSICKFILREQKREKFLLLSYSGCGVEKGARKIRRNNLSLISFAPLLWGSIVVGLMCLTVLNLHALPYLKVSAFLIANSVPNYSYNAAAIAVRMSHIYIYFYFLQWRRLIPFLSDFVLSTIVRKLSSVCGLHVYRKLFLFFCFVGSYCELWQCICIENIFRSLNVSLCFFKMYFKRIITNFNNGEKEEHYGHIPIALHPVLKTIQSSSNRTNILL